MYIANASALSEVPPGLLMASSDGTGWIRMLLSSSSQVVELGDESAVGCGCTRGGKWDAKFSPTSEPQHQQGAEITTALASLTLSRTASIIIATRRKG